MQWWRQRMCPVKNHVAAPGHAPHAADRRKDPLIFRVIDGVPAEDGLDGISNPRSLWVLGEGLRVCVPGTLNDRLNFFETERGSGTDSYRMYEIGGKVRATHGQVAGMRLG